MHLTKNRVVACGWTVDSPKASQEFAETFTVLCLERFFRLGFLHSGIEGAFFQLTETFRRIGYPVCWADRVLWTSHGLTTPSSLNVRNVQANLGRCRLRDVVTDYGWLRVDSSSGLAWTVGSRGGSPKRDAHILRWDDMRVGSFLRVCLL